MNTLWLYYVKLMKAYISGTSFVEFTVRRGSLKVAMRSIIVFTVDAGADGLSMQEIFRHLDKGQLLGEF